MKTIKSFFGGMLISIGCIASMSMPYPIIGAMFFSFGLYEILANNFALFTGAVGFVRNKSEIWPLINTLFFNILGVFCVGLIVCFADLPILEKWQQVASNKFTINYFEFFFRAFLCGIMMYIAVLGWRKTNSFFAVMLPVTIFIMTGMEHSIADAFYLLAAPSDMMAKAWLIILIAVLGNAAGSTFMNLLSIKMDS